MAGATQAPQCDADNDEKEISDEHWFEDTTTWWDEFTEAESRKDTEKMWTLVSDAGERLLGAGQGRQRSDTPKPKKKQQDNARARPRAPRLGCDSS